MTRKTVVPALVSLTALLALGGCGGNDGLTAYGTATVRITGAQTGFNFGSSGLRVDGGGGTRATCQISRGTTTGSYGVVIDLIGNGAAPGREIRSMTVLARTDAGDVGSITADPGGTDFDGACHIDVTDLDEGAGAVHLRTSDCALTAGTETATAGLDFGLRGCTVM